MDYRLMMWMVRRARPMPLYAVWDGPQSRLYVDRADPTQIIAARAVELMAEEALAAQIHYEVFEGDTAFPPYTGEFGTMNRKEAL